MWKAGADYIKAGKYGATFGGIEDTPGGSKYEVGYLSTPPFGFGATSMTETLELNHKIPRQIGLVGFGEVPLEKTEVVKGDVDFWVDSVREPDLAVARCCYEEGVAGSRTAMIPKSFQGEMDWRSTAHGKTTGIRG